MAKMNKQEDFTTMKIEIAKVLLESVKEHEIVLNYIYEYEKMFEKYKFSMDSYGKAEYVKEMQAYVDTLEELQKDIDRYLYLLSI